LAEFEEYEDIYFPKAGWFEDEAVVARLNRKQNHLEWIKFNSKYRQRMLIIEDIDSAWVDVHENPLFLTDGSFLFTSERSGYRHIFMQKVMEVSSAR
jgi:dipeptidyl-peptidase-4